MRLDTHIMIPLTEPGLSSLVRNSGPAQERLYSEAAIPACGLCDRSVSQAKAGPPAPTLNVSPATPVAGDSLVFSGCGWAPTKRSKSGNGNQNPVELFISVPSGPTVTVLASVGASGCFMSDSSLKAVSGAYSVLAAQGGAGKTQQAYLNFFVG